MGYDRVYGIVFFYFFCSKVSMKHTAKFTKDSRGRNMCFFFVFVCVLMSQTYVAGLERNAEDPAEQNFRSVLLFDSYQFVLATGPLEKIVCQMFIQYFQVCSMSVCFLCGFSY